MSAKWDVRDIALAHYNTLRDATTGHYRARDFVVFFGAPLTIAGLAVKGGIHLYDVSKLLGGIAVFTGLLFALVSNVFSLYLRVRRDEGLSPYDPLIADVKELFANVAYAVLVGLGLVMLLVVAASTHTPDPSSQTAQQPLGPIWTAVLIATFFHLLLTVLMALNRLWLAHIKIGELPPKP